MPQRDFDLALERMMAIYKPMAVCFLVGIFVNVLLLAVPLLALPVIFFMCQAGWRAFGLRYVVGHLLLTIILLPVFGLGLLIVPLLVDSDIAKARRAIEPQH